MTRPALAVLVAVGLLTGCPDSDPVPDAGTPVDQGASDAGSVDSGGPDAGAVDTGPTDAGVEDGGAEDLGIQDAATEDTGAEDAGGPAPCPGQFATGATWGSPAGTSVVFAPTGADEVTTPLLQPAEDGLIGYVARLESSRLGWLAQAFSVGSTGGFGPEAVVRDAAEDAVYVVYRTRGANSALRLYDADGTLSAEFAKSGTGDRALVGERGQFNFIAVKYDASGEVVWSTRFGPNDVGGTRSGSTQHLQLTPQRLRVTGFVDVEAPGAMVFGPGTPTASETNHPNEHVFTAAFDRATGAHVAGSARFVEADTARMWGLVSGNGAVNEAGASVIAVAMLGGGSDTVRLGGGNTVTPDLSAGLIVRYDSNGQVDWARTVTKPGSNRAPRPGAVTILADGSVVAVLSAANSSAPLEPYEIQTSGAPEVVNLEGRDTVVVRFTPGGDVAWTYRIGQNVELLGWRLAVDEAADALYLTGGASPRAAFEVASANPIRFDPAGGRYVLKLSLGAGAFGWVEQMRETSSPAPIVVGPRVGAAGLRFPVSGDGVQVGRAPGSPIVDLGLNRTGFGIIELDLAGGYLSCAAVAADADGLWLD